MDHAFIGQKTRRLRQHRQIRKKTTNQHFHSCRSPRKQTHVISYESMPVLGFLARKARASGTRLASSTAFPSQTVASKQLAAKR
jgi:hypothetical protein